MKDEESVGKAENDLLEAAIAYLKAKGTDYNCDSKKARELILLNLTQTLEGFIT